MTSSRGSHGIGEAEVDAEAEKIEITIRASLKPRHYHYCLLPGLGFQRCYHHPSQNLAHIKIRPKGRRSQSQS